MSKFRIILNLTCFFNDHRHTARIFIKETTHTIQDLQDRISSIFQIENFYLSSQNQFLPASEDIGILDKDEVVWVLRNPHNTNVEPVVNSSVATCSKVVKLKPKKRTWESSEQAEITCEKEVIKKAKKSKKTITTCHKAQEISAIAEDTADESIGKPPNRLLSKSNSTGCKSSEISVDKPKDLNYLTSGSSISVLDGLSSSASPKTDISYKKYQPPQPITNSYLEKKKLNIIRIDVYRGANGLDTSETNNINKTSTEDELNDSIPSGYVKSVVEELEKKSSPIFTQNNTITGLEDESFADDYIQSPQPEMHADSETKKTGSNRTAVDSSNKPNYRKEKQFSGVGVLLQNLKNELSETSSSNSSSNASAENLITKRKRHCMHRKTSKTAPTEICSDNNNESSRPKKIPFMTLVKPAMHIKFKDNEQLRDEEPTVVEETEEELKEPQPITNSYLGKKEVNIIRIDVYRSTNSLDTSETNNTNKTSTEDEHNDSIPSVYVKSVEEELLEKNSSPIFTQNNTITAREEEDIKDHNNETHNDNPFNETTPLKNSMLFAESFSEKTMALSNFVNQSVEALNLPYYDGFHQPGSTDLIINKTPKIYENNPNDDNIHSPQPEMHSNKTEKTGSNIADSSNKPNYRRKKQFSGVGVLLQNLKSELSETSSANSSLNVSAENLITKRKRHRVRRKRSKTAPTEICSENKNESPRPKKIIPFIPPIKPAIHIKFEDFKENQQSRDEGPTVVEPAKEELKEKEHSRDEGPKGVEPAEEEPRAKEPRDKEPTKEKQELFTIEIDDSDSDSLSGTTPVELFFSSSMLDSQNFKMIDILPKEGDLISFQIDTGEKNNVTDVSSCIVGRVKEFNKETGKVIFKIEFGFQNCLNSMGVGEKAANYGRKCLQFNWSELVDPRLLYP